MTTISWSDLMDAINQTINESSDDGDITGLIRLRDNLQWRRPDEYERCDACSGLGYNWPKGQRQPSPGSPSTTCCPKCDGRGKVLVTS